MLLLLFIFALNECTPVFKKTTIQTLTFIRTHRQTHPHTGATRRRAFFICVAAVSENTMHIFHTSLHTVGNLYGCCRRTCRCRLRWPGVFIMFYVYLLVALRFLSLFCGFKAVAEQWLSYQSLIGPKWSYTRRCCCCCCYASD